MIISQDKLKQIANRKISEVELKQICDSLNETINKYNIDNKLRVNHFLAKLLQESGCFS